MDRDGDGDVDGVDAGNLVKVLLHPGQYAELRSAFDYNANGRIDLVDLFQFATRLGRKVSCSA